MEKKKERELSLFERCDLKSSNLSKIFTQNVQGELNCLEESLLQFEETVEGRKKGYISYDQLSLFVRENFQVANKDDFIKLLEGFFDMNSLLHGDDRKFVKREHVYGLVEVLKVVNQEFVTKKIWDLFNDKNIYSFQAHSQKRQLVQSSFARITNTLRTHYNLSDKSLNIKKFISKFGTKDELSFLGHLENFLFLKTTFLGGTREMLTALELGKLIEMVPLLGRLSYDFLFTWDVFDKSRDYYSLFLVMDQDARELGNFLHYDKESGVELFSFEEIFSFIIDPYFSDYSTFRKYLGSFLEVKRIFLGTASEKVHAFEIHRLIQDVFVENTSRSVFIFEHYDQKQSLMQQTTPFLRSVLNMRDTTHEQYRFQQTFNRILKDYWFFKGTESSAFYGAEIIRNPLGVVEIAILEDIVIRLYKSLSKPNSSYYLNYAITQKQVQGLLEDFQKPLRSEGMIVPGFEGNTAETIALLTSLFQKQSNGDEFIEVNEMVEFAISAYSSLTVTDLAQTYFKSVCPTDDQGRYTPKCYREHFVGFFQTGDSKRMLLRYFPKFYIYIAELSKAQLNLFLEKVEKFSRTCTHLNDGVTPVLMEEVDMFFILTGLFNMEQIFNRYDRGAGSRFNNNILDKSEVNLAYEEIYKYAVKALVPKGLKVLSKHFYHYLVRHERLPNLASARNFDEYTRELAGYGHLGVSVLAGLVVGERWMRAPADRDVLATVLKTISEQSPEKLKNPYDCDKLYGEQGEVK